MNARILSLFLFLTFLVPARATDDWGTDFLKALAASKETDRPVLVYFTASWCGPCKQMKRTTLSDPKITESVGSFVTVLLDFDHNPDLVKRYEIKGIPAFLVLSADGDPVAKNIGYMDVPQFSGWLTEGLAAAAFAAGQKKVFAENVSKLEQRLASPSEEVRDAAINQIFEFCASTDRMDREYGTRKIEEVGKAEPTNLIAGLTHPKLAVRIQVAKVLREKLGEKFEFDPWLPESERVPAAEKIKTEFARGK